MCLISVLEETLQKCVRDWVVCVQCGSRIVNVSIDGHALQKRARGVAISLDYGSTFLKKPFICGVCELKITI